ncbi:universal stress protein [soil metagenome]
MQILLAITDSPSAEKVVKSVAERSWPAGTSFKILSVLEPVCASSEDMTITEFVHSAGEIYERRKEAAERLCQNSCEKIEAKQPQAIVGYEIQEGAPWAEIVKAASNWPADAIFIGAHDQDIPKRHGSVGQAVLEHAPCAVTVVSSSGQTEAAELAHHG